MMVIVKINPQDGKGIIPVAVSVEDEARLLRYLAHLDYSEKEDVCGFCGKPGADKIPHPVRWPDEESAGTELVHAECEQAECARASALITGKRRDDFLRNCC